MKRKGKIWFFVILLLVAFLAATSITGLKTQYGDIVTTVLRPLNEIKFGSDITGRVNVTLKPESDTLLEEDALLGIKATLQKRLSTMSVTDYIVDLNVDTNEIFVSFVAPTGENVKSAEEIVAALMKSNNFSMRKGNKTDENGNPADETATDIVFHSGQVTSATAATGSINFLKGEEEYISLELSADAQATYAEIFNVMTDEEIDFETLKYSFWLDNEIISTVSFEELYMAYLGTEQVPAIIGTDFTAEFTNELAGILNAGALSQSLKIESYSSAASSDAPDHWALTIAAISLAVVAFFLLAIYRLPGFVAIVALLGQAGATIALVTSYFNVFSNHPLSRFGIVAFYLILGIGSAANIIIGAKLREELRSGKQLVPSLKATFKWGTLAPIVETNILLLIVSIVVLGCFATSGSFFASIMTPALFSFSKVYATPLYSFGFVLFWGVIFNFIFGIFVSWALLTLASRFKIFSSVKLYGGLKDGVEPKETKPAIAVTHRKKFLAIPALLVAAVIACTILLGVKLSPTFETGATVTYSYNGTLSTKDMFTESDLAALNPEKNTDFKISSKLKLEDIVYGGGQLEIRMANTYDIKTLNTLNNILIAKFSSNSITVANAAITTSTSFVENIIRLLVVFVAGFVLIWIYTLIRISRFKVKKALLPVFVLQILLAITGFGVFVVYGMPINAYIVPPILILCGYSLYNLLIVMERVNNNRALYGKKLTLEETGNLSLAQSRGRIFFSSFCMAIMMLGASVYAWLFGGAQTILPISLTLLVGFIVNYILTYFVIAPWWIIRQDKKQ